MRVQPRWSWRIAGLVIASLSALGVAACTASTMPDHYGCDVCVTSAVVYGQVSDANGVPVANASVLVIAYRDSIVTPNSSRAGESNVAIHTDANGRYRDRPISPLSPFRATVKVRVTPVAGTGLGEVTYFGQRVDFRSEAGGAGSDSIRVDVIMPRATP